MHRVITTYRESITVTGNDPYTQSGVGDFYTGSYSGRSPMYGVYAIRVEVVREARRTSDTRYDDNIFSRDT